MVKVLLAALASVADRVGVYICHIQNIGERRHGIVTTRRHTPVERLQNLRYAPSN